MKNNIFDFATGELSQDAFICWCANWFNDDSKPVLKEMSANLLKKFSSENLIESVKVYRQFSRDVKIGSENLSLKIDVLLVVNGKIAVIVEDKTYTGEHDDQISRYVEGLRYIAKHASVASDLYGVSVIRTVYLKTGFMYDADKLVKADVVVTGQDFLNDIIPYSGKSEILDSYIENLTGRLKWYDIHGDYRGHDESFWIWNITKHQIAQYRLMRDIFPETMWKNHDSRDYMVYHGSSFGRPWTEMHILEKEFNGTEDTYSLFWRIDTDNDGPYISLRLYEWFDKKNEEKKARHRKIYEEFSYILHRIIDEESGEFDFSWNDVYPGYRGNYKESSLIHFKLKEKLLAWDEEGDAVINSIRRLSDLFIMQTSV